MAKANYREIEKHLTWMTAFEGNSLSAKITKDENGFKTYRVFSYDTEIATAHNGLLFVNPNKFSVTTSRHQNLIRKAWSI